MNQVEQLLQPLIDQYVWGVDWDCQLSLRMNFGAPHLRIHEPLPSRPGRRLVIPRGDWWLWAYFAFWEISFDGERVAKGGTLKSRSSYKRIVRATTQLDGQTVTGIKVKPRTGTLDLNFDLGGRLALRPIDRRTDDNVWLLYGGDDAAVLTVRSDGRYFYGQRADTEQWAPIS